VELGLPTKENNTVFEKRALGEILYLRGRIISKRMIWYGHVACMEENSIYIFGWEA
jgi:hypothetical protein